MVGLPEGEKTLRLCITVYTQYRRVTDRQTNGLRTDILPRHSPRYAYASLGKNCARSIVLLKLTTDRHEASRGLFATAELLVSSITYTIHTTAMLHLSLDWSLVHFCYQISRRTHVNCEDPRTVCDYTELGVRAVRTQRLGVGVSRVAPGVFAQSSCGKGQHEQSPRIDGHWVCRSLGQHAHSGWLPNCRHVEHLTHSSFVIYIDSIGDTHAHVV